MVTGTGEYDKEGNYALIYKAGKLGNIMISLEISADDIILIYNKYVLVWVGLNCFLIVWNQTMINLIDISVFLQGRRGNC